MISVRVQNRKAIAIARWPITSGSVGLTVEFQFSEEWGRLGKTAVFRGSGVSRDVSAFTVNNTTGYYYCSVPWEVLTEAGGDLIIGIRGANAGGTVVIPTVWANAGYIYEGTEPSEVDPSDPTPSWADQVQAIAQALSASVSKEGNTATITLSDINGTTTATITDGEDGQNGEDGISPTVSVTAIAGGHSVSITDADGTQTFDVMDGQDGQNGTDGNDGEDGSLIWKTDAVPTTVLDGVRWLISDLSGRGGAVPQEGDLVFYSYYYYRISKVVTTGEQPTVIAMDPVNIRGPQGDIPEAPAANGTYVLKCTVTNGTPGYSWAAAE